MVKQLKHSLMVSLFTLVSRVFGLARDMIIAAVFGVSMQSDAFFMAFRPFDLVRKLFSEGMLNISFIPVLTDTIEKDGRKNAVSLIRSMLIFLSAAAVLLIFAGYVWAPFLVKFLAPGFADIPGKLNLTAALLRIMLPYLLFIFAGSVCAGVLNTHEKFSLPAFVPVLFNMVVIFFTLVITKYFSMPVKALSIGVTAAGLIQMALLMVYMLRLDIFRMGRTVFGLAVTFNKKMMDIFKIMIPSMIGAASYQINILAASFFASGLEQGGVSHLYYADRLVQFPLALFAVSASTVFLPEFSKKKAKGRADEISEGFSQAAGLVFFITIPAIAGLIALDKPIVQLLFGFGNFDSRAVISTAQCLSILSSGLWAFTGTRLFASVHYSVSNVRLPFYSGLFAIGCNAVLLYFLREKAGISGIAASVSLSGAMGFLFLFFFSSSQFFSSDSAASHPLYIEKSRICVSACRSVFFSAIMFFTVKTAAEYLIVETAGRVFFAAGLAACIGIGIVIYFLLGGLFSSPEIRILRDRIRKGRLQRNKHHEIF